MTHFFPPSRRMVIAGLTALAGSRVFGAAHAGLETRQGGARSMPFKISLAQWSLHRALFGVDENGDFRQGLSWPQWSEAFEKNPDRFLSGPLKPIDFPAFARTEFDIGAVEYVNRFYYGKALDTEFRKDLKQRAADHDVKSLIVMVDGEGALGNPDESARTQAIENHIKWLEFAQDLGCHAIRVNAASDGSLSYRQQQRLAADGLSRLAERAEPFGLKVIVENHGGLSSHGAWLASVMERADHPNLGTLPDFGNFQLSASERYDNYQGVAELMPYAVAVSAKSYDFDDATGEETTLNYMRLLKTVVSNGYDGYVGIEYEGHRLSEAEGIRRTKNLLEKVGRKIAGDMAEAG